MHAAHARFAALAALRASRAAFPAIVTLYPLSNSLSAARRPTNSATGWGESDLARERAARQVSR